MFRFTVPSVFYKSMFARQGALTEIAAGALMDVR